MDWPLVLRRNVKTERINALRSISPDHAPARPRNSSSKKVQNDGAGQPKRLALTRKALARENGRGSVLLTARTWPFGALQSARVRPSDRVRSFGTEIAPEFSWRLTATATGVIY